MVATYKPIDVSLINEERFWEKVEIRQPEECWEWNRPGKGSGYAVFFISHEYGAIVAHRVSLALAGRAPRIDQQVDHLCRNKICVNPAHLEAVSPQENLRRSHGKTGDGLRARDMGRCVNGHILEEVGTYRDDRRLSDHCAQCGRDAATRYKERRKA